MKKDSSSQQSPKKGKKVYRQQGSVTVGMDLGDKQSCYSVLNDRQAGGMTGTRR
jgi:hypothetical protein